MASKFLIPSVVLASGGIGAAGVGGYMAWTKGKETFRNKYSKAILADSDSLWDTKFASFKKDGKPKHPTLISAKSKDSSSGDNTAKELYKQGCQEIYDSDWNNSSYFDDFKSYCAKTVKEGIENSKKWISEETTNKGKWDTKLTNLKTHNPSQNKTLDQKLEALKTQLSNIAESSFQEGHRKLLKEWCESSQGEIFMGNDDFKTIHSSLYCVES
ncbi:hypothetical protein MHC_03255 [Mycoplasma haemocanis str. Illinois]|uniref:Uncharacterized protein n=1 Tax=Mycoplasma haemocanis (strain Illinois) TaxID=1111676 RepID=H6N789_MYCHN|nr:hypothetical protein [Mycoplasma haemocanis]AEW45511.1 hypothetical protein MHC_03255 [Mycoplasma haemocanis str. Illinois]